MLFTGQYEHTIDAKHRLAIPAEIRSRWSPDVHGSAWYAAPAPGRKIRLYTESGFKARAGEFSLGLTPDQDEADLAATLFGETARLEPDSAGRVRLPEAMLEITGISSQVVVIGVGEWIEIRDREDWKSTRRQRVDEMQKLIKRIEEKRQARRGEPR